MSYLDKFRKHLAEAGMTVPEAEDRRDGAAAVPSRSIQAGDKIFLVRGDGSTPHGVIDFVHRTEDGAIWGFVSFEKNTWAAINLKFARVVA